jgi:methionine synthase II (cobalamin-independent)
VVLGVVPSVDPPTAPQAGQVAEQVIRWLEMLGLDPHDLGDRLGLSPACGLAGASSTWARQALAALQGAATRLS